jgi:hypothetical protein
MKGLFMAIEFFTRGGKGYLPKASIRKPGQIGLNQGSVERYKFNNGDYVLLGYDREQKKIAIRRLNEQEKGAKKVIVKGNNGAISAKSFFDYFNIPYDKSDSYDLEEDKENDLLVFYIEVQHDKN